MTEEYKKEWFKACETNDINFVKSYIDAGNDINMIEDNTGWTGLILASANPIHIEIVKLLLIQPSIDLYIKSPSDKIFLDYIPEPKLQLLDDYDTQKEIIKNNSNNILLFEKYRIVSTRIKIEYSDIFKSHEWGLI